MEKLIVYGSFSCPYCYLASTLVDRVPALPDRVIAWRGVVHDTVPKDGLPVEGELAASLEREVADVARLGGPGFEIDRPACYPDTTIATATLASAEAADPVEADRIRRALFRAYWVDGADIGDPDVVRALAGHVSLYSTLAQEWRQGWLALPRRAVPVLIDAGGVERSAIRFLEQLVGPAPVRQAS